MEVVNMFYILQLGVSCYIWELEEELGIEIFICCGKCLLGMIELGKVLLLIVEWIFNEVSNVWWLVDFFINDVLGVLIIVIIYIQVCYSLFLVIKVFCELFLDVCVELVQGILQEIEVLLYNGGVDIGIVSECLSNDLMLVVFFWFCWYYSLLVLKDYFLMYVFFLMLEVIVCWLLIIYCQGIIGCLCIDEVFNCKGLMLDIVLSVQDFDVIKIYVELGLGVGLVVEQFGDVWEVDIFMCFDICYLFDVNIVWLGLKWGQLQWNYVWCFIELCNVGLLLDEIKCQVMELEEVVIDYQI